MLNLAFWCQALDNTSDDFVSVNGQLVGLEEDAAKSVLRMMARVTRSGKKYFSKSDVHIIINWPEFAVELPCEERDAGNRRSGIMCIGLMSFGGADFDDQVLQQIKDEAQEFSKQIGVTLTARAMLTLNEGFLVLKKKALGQLALRGLLILSLIILIGSLLRSLPAWIKFITSHTT